MLQRVTPQMVHKFLLTLHLNMGQHRTFVLRRNFSSCVSNLRAMKRWKPIVVVTATNSGCHVKEGKVTTPRDARDERAEWPGAMEGGPRLHLGFRVSCLMLAINAPNNGA